MALRGSTDQVREMGGFGVEQARERLRRATAVYAAAETGYWTPHLNGEESQTASTFSQYRERLLEEKHALTVDVLRRLGLQWVGPSDELGATTSRFGETGSKLSPPRLQADKHLKVPVPPMATGPAVSFDDEQRQRRHVRDVQRQLEGGAWAGADGVGQLPTRRSPYEDELKMRFLGSERGRQSSPMPQQPNDRAPQQHSGRDAAPANNTIITPVRHDTTVEWGGRSRCSNTENEGPGANAAAIATPIPGSGDGCGSSSRAFSHLPAEPSPTQSSSSSSWRQLKKLDHHHPRQISPSLVATLPAVVVESGPPGAADGSAGHPHKRMRKISTEEDPDSINIAAAAAAAGSSRGSSSYYAYNGSPLMVPGSEASSLRTSASMSPSPPLPRLGFYLGSPLADSASSSSAAAVTVAATATTAANKCSFSSDSDNLTHHTVSSEWHREQPRAVGGGGGGSGRRDEDAAAAAVRVLGLRNGHMSAAAAAVAATQPAAAGAVGSKRSREAVEQTHDSMPAAVQIVHNPSTATQGNGVGDIGGRRPPAGARQRVEKSGKESGTAGAPKGAQACRDVGCHRRPIYAFKGDTKALCCPIHRSKEMVNVRHPLCRHESCFRQPSFGMEGDQRASYCSEHKARDMINVSSRRCQATGCLRHPNFGFQGDRRATYCCRHKATGMIDVVSRRCQHPQCVRRPLYAMPGQRAMFCRTHKDPGHTDVVSRRCNFEGGCDRHPSFGWKHADGKARRCAHHRLEGMESVKVNNRRGSAANAAANALKTKRAR
eukprot:g6452.t1